MLRRHAPDAVSLVFGTLFAGSAVIWLLSATDDIDYNEAWLAGPAILIVAGVVGLAVALRPSQPTEQLLWAAPPPVEYEDTPTAPIATEPTTELDVQSEIQSDKHTE
jgi:hypothetical protein